MQTTSAAEKNHLDGLILEQLGTPLREQRGANTWMGVGIGTPATEQITLPVDMIPFLIWSDRAAKKRGGRAKIVVADTLVSQANNVDHGLASTYGSLLAEALTAVAENAGCSLQVMRWDAIEADPKYRALRDPMVELAKVNNDFALAYMRLIPGYKDLQPGSPQFERVRNSRIMRYGISEVAASIHLAIDEGAVKVGHIGERLYDVVAGRAMKGRSGHGALRIETESDFSAVHLFGGYRLSAETPRDYAPPYLACDGEDRIFVGESLAKIEGKMRVATPLYRRWCATWLREIDPSVSEDDPGKMARLLCNIGDVGALQQHLTTRGNHTTEKKEGPSIATVRASRGYTTYANVRASPEFETATDHERLEMLGLAARPHARREKPHSWAARYR